MLDMTWYDTLIRPTLTPPAWIFAPVWTILYIMMLVSAIVFVTRPTTKGKAWGFVLFIMQLGVNLCWSPAFFYLHNIGFALALIILLDILTLLTIIEFFKVSKISAYLLVPYFIWILFATYLNIGYFVLN